MKYLVAFVLISLLSCSGKVKRNETLEALNRLSAEIRIDTIKPGKGIDDIFVGQKVKAIIKSIGAPTGVLSRNGARADTVFFPVIDSTAFFSFYTDFDTVYHFQNKNKYGLAHVYSKNGTALVLGFSYIFDNSSINALPNGNIHYFDSADKIKKDLGKISFHYVPKDDPLLKDFGIAEDKIEDLYFFELGINFMLYKNGMEGFTIYAPASQNQYDKLVANLENK